MQMIRINSILDLLNQKLQFLSSVQFPLKIQKEKLKNYKLIIKVSVQIINGILEK